MREFASCLTSADATPQQEWDSGLPSRCLKVLYNLIRARMGLLVGRTQVGGADVRVYLRCDQAFVAEEFLDAADVGAAV